MAGRTKERMVMRFLAFFLCLVTSATTSISHVDSTIISSGGEAENQSALHTPKEPGMEQTSLANISQTLHEDSQSSYLTLNATQTQEEYQEATFSEEIPLTETTTISSPSTSSLEPGKSSSNVSPTLKPSEDATQATKAKAATKSSSWSGLEINMDEFRAWARERDIPIGETRLSGNEREEETKQKQSADPRSNPHNNAVDRPHDTSHDDNSSDETSNVCSLWIAPSTLKGAGLGLFVGQAVSARTALTTGDLVVPLTDFNSHNSPDPPPNIWLDSYMWWSGEITGMKAAADSLQGASFGVGAIPNGHNGLINGELSQAAERLNDPRDHVTTLDPESLRGISAAAGSYTPFYDRQLTATVDMAAGQEIFLDYGPDYFDDKPGMELVPTRKSYKAANRLLREFTYVQEDVATICRKSKDNTDCETAEWWKDLYDDVIMGAVAKNWPSRTTASLPYTAQEVPKLLKRGVAKRDAAQTVQSLEWLQTHGACLDGLVIGPSEQPHAGRGAFATQGFEEGDRIAPIPLIHIADKQDLDMHALLRGPLTRGGGYRKPRRRLMGGDKGSEPLHKQLLLNYCWSHAESTLLLCPYGHMTSAINHAMTPMQPNAKLVWNKELSMHSEWLKRPLSKWAHLPHSGLVWDLVATSEIQPGDEVLLDYGEAWEDAWKEHFANWVPPDDAHVYQTAAKLNDMTDDEMGPLPTYLEASEGPTVLNSVDLYCREHYRKVAGLSNNKKTGSGLTACRILSRRESDAGFAYLVEILPSSHSLQKVARPEVVLVSRDAFWFEDLMYSMDYAQEWSFRQEAYLPDDLFPDDWKNLPASPFDNVAVA